MAAPVEMDIRGADTHLALDCTAADTTLTLGHAGTFPAGPWWAVICPDDPSEREEILVTSVTGQVATVVRGCSWTAASAHKAGLVVRHGVRAASVTEDWHVVGAAGEPAFANGWTNTGGAFATAAFRRTPDGLVLLRGRITPGAAVTVFTLPAGYRPTNGTLSFTSEVGAGFRIDVLTSGVVQALGGPGSSALDCARFWAGA